jgi:3-dehydroquinate dehydratase-2
MQITIINGPNLNLLGKRETDVYGNESFESFLPKLQEFFPVIKLDYFQSNIEGELVDAIQQHGFTAQGIVLNPGGYSHTSVAIGDAVAAVPAKVIEVHISNIFAREEFRKFSHISAKSVGVISGLGLKGYELAIKYLLDLTAP